jgi:hypothetical protein
MHRHSRLGSRNGFSVGYIVDYWRIGIGQIGIGSGDIVLCLHPFHRSSHYRHRRANTPVCNGHFHRRIDWQRKLRSDKFPVSRRIHLRSHCLNRTSTVRGCIDGYHTGTSSRHMSVVGRACSTVLLHPRNLHSHCHHRKRIVGEYTSSYCYSEWSLVDIPFLYNNYVPTDPIRHFHRGSRLPRHIAIRLAHNVRLSTGTVGCRFEGTMALVVH